MNLETLYQAHAVKLICNGIEGSGCLVQQPLDGHSYVFTAKHCLTEDTQPCLKEEIQVYRHQDQSPIKVLDVFLHKVLDIAVIKVERVIELQESKFKQPIRGNAVTLYGYPHLLRKGEEKRQNLSMQVSFVRQSEFDMVVDNVQFTFARSTGDVIRGFSGGGVFFEDERGLSLTGIFTRLKAVDGAYANLTAISIDEFRKFLIEIGEASEDIDSFEGLKTDSHLLKDVFSLTYTPSCEPYYLARAIDAVFTNYLSHTKHIWLYGPSGVGKTLLALRNLTKDNKRANHIDLTCSTTEMLDEYFVSINHELITQCGIENPAMKGSIMERLADNLCIVNKQSSDVFIFVDEVPISEEKKFFDFVSAFIKISDRYANVNQSNNRVKWIISTRIDPTVHLNRDEKMHANGLKAYKHFVFKKLTLWTGDDLKLLLQMLQTALSFSVSSSTAALMVQVADGLPGRMKSIIERVILERCSIAEAIEIVKAEKY